jgi:hypothetical protein
VAYNETGIADGGEFEKRPAKAAAWFGFKD